MRWIFRDRETETEDPVAIPVEERVEREHVALASGVDKLAIGAAILGLSGPLYGWLGHISSGR